MDAFEAAFRLPNLLRRLFAEGAFSQAFVPILAEYRRQRGDDATRALVGTRRHAARRRAARAVRGRRRSRRRGSSTLLAGGFARTPGKVELDGRDDPHRLPVHPVRVAGLARRRRANVFRRFAIPAFTPVLLEPVDHRRGDLPRAATVDPPILALAWGVCDRRPRAARCCRSGRCCAIGMLPQARLRLARRRRAPRAARDGARGDRRVGGADLGADQHAARGVARRRPHLVDHVRRPADGVSERAARRRARHDPAAVARAASQRRGHASEYSALLDWGLRLAVAARAAGGGRAVRCSRCRSSSTLYQYGRFTVNDVMQTRARAARLQRRAARR